MPPRASGPCRIVRLVGETCDTALPKCDVRQAPKEQPPRKLSGKRAARRGTLESKSFLPDGINYREDGFTDGVSRFDTVGSDYASGLRA